MTPRSAFQRPSPSPADHAAETFSTAELRARGLRPRPGEKPAVIETWRFRSATGQRFRWRLTQVTEIKPRTLIAQPLEQTAANVLRATWTINRAAKRRRNAAESTYENALHGFAGHHKRQKQTYYGLKDRGIAWLADRGDLAAVYCHARLIVWAGNGYSFHSTLAPAGGELTVVGDDLVRVEAKPPASQEMRLIDAAALLGGLPDLIGNFARVAMPS